MQIRAFLLLLFLPNLLSAQSGRQLDIDYLCSDKLAGRGYVNNGLILASDYIAKEFKKAGLKAMNETWFQPFEMAVNTFPSAMKVKLGNRQLTPGVDYLVKASSATLKGKFNLVFASLRDIETDSAFAVLLNRDWSKSILVVDTMTYEDDAIDKRYKRLIYNQAKARGIIIKSKRRLLWTVAREQSTYLSLECTPQAILPSDESISISVQAEFNPHYRARNVWGYVPGTSYPDSFLVICAHYDHLGKMGAKTIFPGANDNASGTAMLLELARYYGANPQAYSVLFVAFTAEEAGLVGSKFYTDFPPFPLSQIRFLMNLDLVGTGRDGITVVNATVFDDDYQTLLAVNDSGKYLPTIVPRGKAANSDHYWFGEKGVPSFFIYQMGDYGHYHDPGDQSAKLPLDAFLTTQQLIIHFFSLLQGQQ